MTTTITTNRNSVTDFTAYLYSFNEDFTPRDKAFYETTRAGEFYGVIAGSAANIGDTVRPNAMGYLMGDAVGSIGTLQTISRVAFGDGVYSTRNDLKMSIPSYTVEFSPEIGGAIAGFMRLIVERLGDATNKDMAFLLNSMLRTDVIFHGAGGNDVFRATDEADILDGKAGADTLYGGKGADEILGGKGGDSLFGGNGHDTINGQKGSDTVSGGKGNDTIQGGNGRNTLSGGADDDMIHGGAGADTIHGNIGADTLNAGGGVNTVTGGKGADHFVFTATFKKTVITDFGRGGDQLDFSGFAGQAKNFDQFKTASIERDGKVIYDRGGDDQNKIVLLDTTLDDLSASDFIF
ncbi:calcium-binding protein [Chachezhania antarctica]|uniref:calcium-binding protein n=1 Tax=Chachezhania antarctica TaxID=2340860 RepID=UPI000EAE2657|nr:calcium-binding protein [Chachezhania antarctica]|tara:strand:+ start:8141 stop:9190 length:1050 start_codon:yes stop_codon:yes gene_type:complete